MEPNSADSRAGYLTQARFFPG